MNQQNSFLQNVLPVLLLAMLAGVAYFIYKNNPSIMIPEPFYKSLIKKGELASITINFTEPIQFSELKDPTDNIKTLGHRWSELKTDTFQPPAIESKPLFWSLFNKQLLVAEKKRFQAFNLKGEMLWSFLPLPDTEFAPGQLAHLDQTVYLSTRDGHLYALEVSTGKLLWFYESASDFLYEPVLVDEKIVIISSTKNTPNWRYLVLNASTGELINEGENFSQELLQPPTVYRKSVLLNLKGGQFRVANIETGKLMWSTDASTNYVNQPYVANDRVFLFDESGLLSIYDFDSGQKISETLMTTPLVGSLGLIDDSPLIIGTSAENELIAIDLKAGSKSWGHSLNMGSLKSTVQYFKLSAQSQNQLSFASKVKGWAAWSPCNGTQYCIYDAKTGLLLYRIDIKGKAAGPFELVAADAESPAMRLFVPAQRGDKWLILGFSPPQTGPK